MKNISLDFTSRLRLSNILATATGHLGKMSALQQVFERIKFTEPEFKQIKVVDLGNGMYNNIPPTPEFGSKKFEVEDAVASVLLQELESHQHFTMMDIPWVEAIKVQLKKEPGGKK